MQPKQTNLFGETLPTWHVYEFPKDKYQQFVEVGLFQQGNKERKPDLQGKSPQRCSGKYL